MLSDQRSPYVGRFARGWRRLPGRIPGQPQTRTRARPSIGTPGEGPRRGQEVHLARSRRTQGVRAGSGRGARGQHVVDEEHPSGHRPAAGLERPLEGPAAIGAGSTRLGAGGDPAPQEAGAGTHELGGRLHRQEPSLVVSALRTSAARERHPRDHVGDRERPRQDHGAGQRAAHAPPPRELQPVDRPAGQVPRRRTERAPTSRRAVDSPGRRARTEATGVRTVRTRAAPAPSGLAGTPRRTATGPPRTPRIAAGRPRPAPVPTHADRTSGHRHALTGSFTSKAPDAPFTSIPSRSWSLRTGYAVTRPRPVASSNSTPIWASAIPSAVSFIAAGVSAAYTTLIESPPHSTCSMRTFPSPAATALPTGTVPRRTVARGHAIGNGVARAHVARHAVHQDVARQLVPAGAELGHGELEGHEEVEVGGHVERRGL